LPGVRRNIEQNGHIGAQCSLHEVSCLTKWTLCSFTRQGDYGDVF
jgi:hypothetical protein